VKGEGRRAQDFAGFKQVMEIGPGIALAGVTGAGVINGRLVPREAGVFEVEVIGAVCMRIHERAAMTAEPGGVNAIEGVDAGGNVGLNIMKLADPKKVCGAASVEFIHGEGRDIAHLTGRCPERATDGLTEERRVIRRITAHGAKIFIHPALDHAVKGLLALGVLCKIVEAAPPPARTHVHGRLRIAARHMKGRALVKGHNQIGAQFLLNRHGRLWGEKVFLAIAIGREHNALLRNFELGAHVTAGATLDLIHHMTMAETKDLKPPRIREHRPIPGHEVVEPAHLAHKVSARLKHQMIGVGENDGRACTLQLIRAEPLERRFGSTKNERRRLDGPVRCFKPPDPRMALCALVNHLKGKILIKAHGLNSKPSRHTFFFRKQRHRRWQRLSRR
jgi:hypothetical protein